MKVLALDSTSAGVAGFFELTKPRITILVVATTLVGFYLGATGPIKLFLLAHTLLGTMLVAAGASALNMVLEWNADARMRRTENRPIPSGRITIFQGMNFGLVLAAAGIAYLLFFVNLLTAVLAAVTILLYLFAYTPLKKKTPLCTLVGAVPGAIPPMMGWAAITGRLGFEAWWLFSILFLWQLPHFLSIAWLYKEDYARGGFPMLPVVDPDGSARQIVVQTMALAVITIIPGVIGFLSSTYFAGAVLLGIAFCIMGLRMAIYKSMSSARHLLLTSVLYLPLLLILMMVGKQS